jgi:hypothetical protein
MKKALTLSFITFFVLGTLGIVYAASYPAPPAKNDPPGSFRIFYEWDNFTPGKPNVQKPGADLQGPGDSYRFTVIRNDKWSNDPSLEVVRAMIGVHINDYDWSKESGDAKSEWGKILINGSPAQFVIFSPVDKRKPGSSEFLEIAGDEEISPEGAEIPPYIFFVTDEMKKSKSVTVEIINLRSDGTTNSNAPYGNFVVNRVGTHVWYKKK